ncbi:MAG: glutamine synthetase [Candidatus Deianiraeaceae bacterium]|jgi:glutamine synthetase
MTFKDFQTLIEEKEIQYVDFRFTDLCGIWHHITYHISEVDSDLIKNGVSFDGSSINGWKEIEESDMYFIPDLSTAFTDPFSAQETIVVSCDVYDPNTGKGYERDPRTIAKKTMQYFKETNIGDAAYFGPEPEFFIFDGVEKNTDKYSSSYKVTSSELHNVSNCEGSFNLGHYPSSKGGYFPVAPVDHHVDIRSEMVTIMRETGLEAMLHHHEVASSQGEIGIKFNDLLKTADNVQKYKYIVKNVAATYGKTATFMPKPISTDNGSGMHVHQSIWKGGKNTFAGKEIDGLSENALYYIGGIIKHGKALNAFANSTTNSYKRLVPGYEAPVYLAYSSKNRSASIRIPYSSGEKAKRIEARFPDPLANPYLLFSAFLLAGIDGIKNKIHPGEAATKNLYKLSKEEELSVPRVCETLKESLNALNEDRAFLTASGVFNDALIDSYIQIKMSEIRKVQMTPNPMEFSLYYSS